MREADSAACGKEDVKLGQQLHLGIQPAEWRRQGAPGVHTKYGDPSPTRPDICFPTGEPLVLEYRWDDLAQCSRRVMLSLRGRNRLWSSDTVTKRA